MPKPKSKSRAKTKAKAKTKTKTRTGSGTRSKSKPTVGVPPLAPERPQVALTTEQQFYVKGNMEILSDDQIAADLRIHVDDVRSYIQSYERAGGASRMNKLLQRPSKGVVAMTESASMAADDIRKAGVVTQAEINAAAAAGNPELASKLAEKRQAQIADEALQRQARYGHCWHKIRPEEGSR